MRTPVIFGVAAAGAAAIAAPATAEASSTPQAVGPYANCCGSHHAFDSSHGNTVSFNGPNSLGYFHNSNGNRVTLGFSFSKIPDQGNAADDFVNSNNNIVSLGGNGTRPGNRADLRNANLENFSITGSGNLLTDRGGSSSNILSVTGDTNSITILGGATNNNVKYSGGSNALIISGTGTGDADTITTSKTGLTIVDAAGVVTASGAACGGTCAVTQTPTDTFTI